MQTPESIALATPISEADQLLTMEPVVVDVADSLHQIAEQAVQNAACRVIAVVEHGQRLVGVIPVRALVNDIFLKIVPEEFLAEITDSRQSSRTPSTSVPAPRGRHARAGLRSPGPDGARRVRAHARTTANGPPITDADGSLRATSTSSSCCWCGCRRPRGGTCSSRHEHR